MGAPAALRDEGWQRAGEAVIRRNLAALREVAPLVVEPQYGFSCVVDCSGLGASAQEIMVALCSRKVAVYPGDGLGEVGATTTIRLNLSDPDPRGPEPLRGGVAGGGGRGGDPDLARRGARVLSDGRLRALAEARRQDLTICLPLRGWTWVPLLRDDPPP